MKNHLLSATALLMGLLMGMSTHAQSFENHYNGSISKLIQQKAGYVNIPAQTTTTTTRTTTTVSPAQPAAASAYAPSPAKASRTNRYNKHGLSVDIPVGFKVEEDEWEDGMHGVIWEQDNDDNEMLFGVLHGHSAELSALESLGMEFIMELAIEYIKEELADENGVDYIGDVHRSRLGNINGQAFSFTATDDGEKFFGEIFFSFQTGQCVFAIKAAHYKHSLPVLDRIAESVRIQ